MTKYNTILTWHSLVDKGIWTVPYYMYMVEAVRSYEEVY